MAVAENVTDVPAQTVSPNDDKILTLGTMEVVIDTTALSDMVSAQEVIELKAFTVYVPTVVWRPKSMGPPVPDNGPPVGVVPLNNW